MRTEERWIQQLYLVDEMLGKILNLPLPSIEFKQ